MLLRRYHKAKEEEIKEKVETIEIDRETSIADLNKLKVNELKVVAKEKGLEGYYSMTKAELIELIERV